MSINEYSLASRPVCTCDAERKTMSVPEPHFEFELMLPTVTNSHSPDNRNYYGCDPKQDPLYLRIRPLVTSAGEHRTLVVPAAIVGIGSLGEGRMSVSALRMLSRACEEAALTLERWERDTKGVLGRGGVGW